MQGEAFSSQGEGCERGYEGSLPLSYHPKEDITDKGEGENSLIRAQPQEVETTCQ